MVEISFIFRTIPLTIKSTINENFSNIFTNFALKIGHNVNDLIFIYSGGLIDPQKTFNEVANDYDKKEGKMSVLVYSTQDSSNNYSGINNINSSQNITLEGLFSTISQMKNVFTNEINSLKNEITYLKNEIKNINSKKNNFSMNKEIDFDKNKNSEIKEYIDTLFKRSNERNIKLFKQTKVYQADNAIRLQNSTIGVNPENIVKVENNGKIFSDIIFTRGMIMAWYGTIDLIPKGWALCDGTDGRPNLTDKFILGTNNPNCIGQIGGQSFIKLSKKNLPPIGTAGFGADSHNGRNHHQSNGFLKFQGHYSVGVKNGHADDWGSNWLIDLNEGMKSSPINIMNPYLMLFYIIKL